MNKFQWEIVHDAIVKIIAWSMDISVIIVTWNSEKFIARCLTSLVQAVNGINAEIIVVDNASMDGTVALIRDRFTDVQRVVLPRNTGFAHACNVGIAHARGRYVGFLNPDAEARGLAFTHLVHFLDAHPRAAVAGGMILNHDNSIQPSVHRFPTPFTALGVALKLHRVAWLRRVVRGGFETVMPERTALVDYVKGAFFVARTSFLNEVAGFDERYFLWFDEVDLQKAARVRGWEVWYYPKACAIHAGGKSFMQVDVYENQKQFLTSMAKYLYKWHGKKCAFPVRIVTPFILLFYRLFSFFTH